MERRPLNSIAALSHFAGEFVTAHPGGGVFGLAGDLGVGKTTFVREVIGALCARAGVPVPRVISPTYVLHQLYNLRPTVDHFDLYRLENLQNEGLLEIGYFEALDRADQGGFVFVEWPERIAPPRAPVNMLRFSFTEAGRELLT